VVALPGATVVALLGARVVAFPGATVVALPLGGAEVVLEEVALEA